MPAASTVISPPPGIRGTFEVGGPLGVAGGIDRQHHRRRGEDQAAARQAVQAVGQVDGVRGADDAPARPAE